ncbi:MAG: FHA domain-containing protein [Prevotella sp.]|jgi:hypothetical protein|nr:FHA domain-containing protein [Prevotella sp.]
MSQNKTVIQGLEPADAPNQNMGAGSSFYTRGARGTSRGTVVSGMTDQVAGTPNQGAQSVAEPQQPKRPITTGKPVVGFLYSVSRTAAGEYWPLQIGQNTIGQSPDCDIMLPEGTVSSEHAVLVVRKMKKPEKVIASLSDARSTNGTMLNGESLGFSAVECKNGDIITIGDNYELLLILIDAPTLGLSVSENFIAIETEDDFYVGQPDTDPNATRPGDGYQPFAGPTPPPFGFNPGGTVGFDGSGTGSDKGGTIGM